MSEEAFQSFEAVAATGHARETAVLRGLLDSQDDVRRVMALEVLPSSGPLLRWLYLIETPFMTFPKFVVGTTNSNNTEIEILLACGSEWAATDAFNLALEHGGKLPAER